MNKIRVKILTAYFLLAFFPCLSPRIFGQQVDKFTGDFSYSVPLFKIPAPYGPEVPIAAIYRAGITVDQPASAIGLGWELSAGGEIERSIFGLPDDWDNISVPNPNKGDVTVNNGVLQLDNGFCEDIYTTKYKMGKNAASFPAYDFYYVKGPVSGLMQPAFLDFLNIDVALEPPTITKWQIEPSAYSYYSPYTYRLVEVQNDNYTGIPTYGSSLSYSKPQFRFMGDFHGNINSRHYPWSSLPVSNSTPVFMPGEVVNGSSAAYDGNGYNSTDNRLKTAKYVRYFTNNEIAAHYSGSPINGFIDFETATSSDRSNTAKYDLNGIGAFDITDELGYTYHYSLPVYMHKIINGSYPLNYDYSSKDYTDVTSTANYVLKDNKTGVVLEYQQEAKTAMKWLLTAITGPDYSDANSNGLPDQDDRGYWVNYEWKLWSENFKTRTPFLGAEITYAPSQEDPTAMFPFNDEIRITGKAKTFSSMYVQQYYINRISTATHSAVFVRDLRFDEHSAPADYDNATMKFAEKVIMPDPSDNIIRTEWSGILYDDGGPEDEMGKGVIKSYSIKIAPAGAEGIKLTVDTFEFNSNSCDEFIEIYGAPTSEDPDGPLLGRFGSDNSSCGFGNLCFDPENIAASGCQLMPGTVILIPGAQITIKTQSHHGLWKGFAIRWEGLPKENNPSVKVIPQLKVSRIILMENADLANLPSPSTYPINNNSAYSHDFWDLGNTTVASSGIFSNNWYTQNSGAIKNVSLKTVEFKQDYSLAKRYFNNINVSTFPMFNSDKLDPPAAVKSKLLIEQATLGNSGKLTLNKIVFYDFKHSQVIPSYLFDYKSSIEEHNPGYDPEKKDYWGFYKPDVSANAFSRYTTDASVQKASVWSLKKITTPIGAEIELEYEPDEYEKVFSDAQAGSFTGAVRTFSIKEAQPIISGSGQFTGWTITMEDNAPEFEQLLASAPAGTLRRVVIPYSDANDNVCNDFGYLPFINYGTGATITPVGANVYTTAWQDFTFDECDKSVYPYGPASPVYTGNGYVSFELPAGVKVKGGGIRVKKLITKNAGIDNYITEYSYQAGVTPSEADRFSLPGQEDFGGNSVLLRLRASSSDPHKMSPEVGYTKVTERVLGQIGLSQGDITSTFITSDFGIDRFTPTSAAIQENTAGCDAILDTTYVINVSDKFSTLWGREIETEIRDKNDNIISSTKNEFNSTGQGATVELFNFKVIHTYPQYGGPQPCGTPITNTVSILRKYPVRLTKQTTSTNGLDFISMYETFDNVTGMATKSKDISPVEGTVTSEILPAYKINDYSNMGPKSESSANKNILTVTTMKRVIVDEETSGGNNFLSFDATTFINSLPVRTFDKNGAGMYQVSAENIQWVPHQLFMAMPPLVNDGLHDASQLATFTFGSHVSTQNWRLQNEPTLFDKWSHVLEIKEFNNRQSAKKYAHDERYLIAEITNCNYESFACTSFEEITDVSTGFGGPQSGYFEGEVKKEGDIFSTGIQQISSTTTIKAHAGTYLLKVNGGTSAVIGASYKVNYNNSNELDGLLKGRIYRASVWVHNSSPNEAALRMNLFNNGSTQTINTQKNNTGNVQIDDWVLMNVEIEVPNSLTIGAYLKVEVINSGTAAQFSYFDDLRIHPVEAPMSVNVFDPKRGLVTAVLDNNNFATKFVHDASGRILETWKEIEGVGLKKLSASDYHFYRAIEPIESDGGGDGE